MTTPVPVTGAAARATRPPTRPLTAADQAEIRQVLALFAHVYDNLAEDALDAFFTNDVVVEIGAGAGRTVRGIDEARAFRHELGPDSPDHQTVDIVLLTDPDGTVRARSRYLAILADGTVTNGDYLDVLTRTPRGWRISHRRTVPRYPRQAAVASPPSEVAGPWRIDGRVASAAP